MTKKEFGRGD